MRKLFLAMVVVLTSSMAYAQTDGGVQQKPAKVAKTKVVTPDQIPSRNAPATLPRTTIDPLVGKIKCDGIQVNGVEALGFGMSYDVFIFVTGQVLASQHKSYNDFLDEPTQMKIVSLLKRNDAIVKAATAENRLDNRCLTVTPDEALVALKEMLHMEAFIQANHADAMFDEFFLKLAGDEKTGMALVNAAGSYTKKLAVLAKTSPNFGK